MKRDPGRAGINIKSIFRKDEIRHQSQIELLCSKAQLGLKDESNFCQKSRWKDDKFQRHNKLGGIANFAISWLTHTHTQSHTGILVAKILQPEQLKLSPLIVHQCFCKWFLDT